MHGTALEFAYRQRGRTRRDNQFGRQMLIDFGDQFGFDRRVLRSAFLHERRAGKSIGQGIAIGRPVGRRIGGKAELLQDRPHPRHKRLCAFGEAVGRVPHPNIAALRQKIARP